MPGFVQGASKDLLHRLRLADEVLAPEESSETRSSPSSANLWSHRMTQSAASDGPGLRTVRQPVWRLEQVAGRGRTYGYGLECGDIQKHLKIHAHV
jgi:hypothetical protein